MYLVEDWQLDIDAMTLEQAHWMWKDLIKNQIPPSIYFLERLGELRRDDPIGWAILERQI